MADNGSGELYRHRQWGIVMIAILCICSFSAFLLAPFLPITYFSHWLAAILLLCAWLFSSLLITIDKTHLRWRFGPGLIRKEVPLSDCRSAQIVRIRWYRSWGIHLTSRGWLYTVGGRDAVLIKLNSGPQFIIGCNEPNALVRVLRESLTSH